MRATCFLIGFMGSGKTYWGERLSKRLGVPFVDLDAIIEAAAGQSIAAIFAQADEAHFRRLEKKHLREQADSPPCVMAVGGGTPCFFDNMAWMNAHGITMYLQVPAPILVARLRLGQATRPLLQGIGEHELEAHITRLLEQRDPVYRQAQVVLPFEDDESVFLERLVGEVVAQRDAGCS